MDVPGQCGRGFAREEQGLTRGQDVRSANQAGSGSFPTNAWNGTISHPPACQARNEVEKAAQQSQSLAKQVETPPASAIRYGRGGLDHADGMTAR